MGKIFEQSMKLGPQKSATCSTTRGYVYRLGFSIKPTHRLDDGMTHAQVANCD